MMRNGNTNLLEREKENCLSYQLHQNNLRWTAGVERHEQWLSASSSNSHVRLSYRVHSESECEQCDEAVEERLEWRSERCASPGLLFDQRAVAEPDAVDADASPELAPLP